MPLRNPPTGRRFFSLDEANRMLPLIRHIVEDLAATAKRYERLQSKLDQVASREIMTDEQRQWELELSEYADRLEDCLQEMRSLGVEFKGWEGLVDFPAWVNGREIEYCWKQGEPEVAHWHELYAGFSNRKPLPVTDSISPVVILGDASMEEFVPDDVTKVTSKRKVKASRTPVKRSDEVN